MLFLDNAAPCRLLLCRAPVAHTHISTFGIYSSHGSRENVRINLAHRATAGVTDQSTDYNNPSLRMRVRRLIGASVSEPPLVIVDSTDALSRYYWGERERAPSCGLNGRAVTIYIYVRTFTATAHARRYAQM